MASDTATAPVAKLFTAWMHPKRPVRAPTDPVLTPRLVLTPVGPDDIDDLVVLCSDPEVAYWTGPWTHAAVEAWAEDMAGRWTRDGVGKWMARDRSDESLVQSATRRRVNATRNVPGRHWPWVKARQHN